MKKLFTIVAFISTFVPAIYAIVTPAGLPNELVTLIQNADSENFKNKFDTFVLTPEHLAALQQIVAETKVAITKEIETMKEKNKSWTAIAKGGLATVSGSAIGLVTAIFDIALMNAEIQFAGRAPFISDKKRLLWSATALASLVAGGISYKSIAYGVKSLTSGWNYKQQLQDKLTKLDAIDAYITGTSSATTSPSLISHIKNADADAFINELKDLLTLNQTANKPYIAQKNWTELAQCALETKNKLEQELREALSNGKNVAWQKLIGGSLVCVPSGFFAFTCLLEVLEGISINSETCYQLYMKRSIIGVPLVGWLSSKAFIYGANIVSNGWNYQQQLREKLKNLDIIITHIAQAKA